jgi:hypothetical protein
MMIVIMKTYDKVKAKLLEDKEIASAYNKLGAEFALIQMIIGKRL